MKCKSLQLAAFLLVITLFSSTPLAAQERAASTTVAANLTLPAATSPLSVETLLDPTAPAWEGFAPRQLALNRTPRLYPTDPPAQPEISRLEVRVARVGDQLLVRLSWRDARRDAAELSAAPEAPPENRDRKELTPATGRFFDAAAVMYPTGAQPSGLTPSLQMGEEQKPVTIYYWNATRGPALMEAHGRSTTRRTGESFPARGLYGDGRWQVTLALPDLPAGVPLAFAIWNGSQLDRDGRKYFTVWHWLE